jgi:hypothetical protein
MGTGFTVDSPVRVARYGISSVLSIGDDILLEAMREQLCSEFHQSFVAIADGSPDVRAARITAYLNLLQTLVTMQAQALHDAPFEPGSEICRYFELLPESPLKRDYRRMMVTGDPDLRKQMQERLRSQLCTGSIDVNIMTKVDGPVFRIGVEQTPDQTVAVSALRGFARSNLSSSIVFSAGMNRRLFTSLEQYPDFFAQPDGTIRKKIVLKVSDYRSAHIQGKLLASRGLWVSEYRVESGLNCGGHAFPTKGHLMGPILDEFRANRPSMLEQLYAVLTKSLRAANREAPGVTPPPRFTAQGGIGTPEEDSFLRRYYDLDGTGWGTPFLLVPEVTNVDYSLLAKLAAATDADVYLSDASPLGVPFWNLRSSASENARRHRIESGSPGSSCPKGFLRLNTDHSGQPLCTASKTYQKRRLREISGGDLTSAQKVALTQQALAKACICHELSGGVAVKRGFDAAMASAVCPGPGIADYSRPATLDEMVDHIYGRFSLITNADRPHMFVRELMLYIDYLKSEMDKSAAGLADRAGQYYVEFKDNLLSGIEYYRDLADKFGWEQREKFLADIDALGEELKSLIPDVSSLIAPVNPALAGGGSQS